MKVFLSWSGARSHAVAEALRDWLPDVINAVEPWLSSDIEKGAASMNEIATSLQGCSFGIICVTPGNQDRPWINYEAGALSKSVGDDPGRVATLLVGISRPSEVTGPLSQFQATKIELTDIKKLMVTIDRHTDGPRESWRVEGVVERLWPQLKEKLEAAIEIEDDLGSPVKAKRSPDEKLDELLELIREIARQPEAPKESAPVPPWVRTSKRTGPAPEDQLSMYRVEQRIESPITDDEAGS